MRRGAIIGLVGGLLTGLTMLSWLFIYSVVWPNPPLGSTAVLGLFDGCLPIHDLRRHRRWYGRSDRRMAWREASRNATVRGIRCDPHGDGRGTSASRTRFHGTDTPYLTAKAANSA